MSRTARHSWKRKFAIAVLSACIVFLCCVFALSRPQHDFIEYWSAAHLLCARANPYSLLEMLKLQNALGWHEGDPLMFVCPPWALPLIAPLGLVSSYSLAWMAWMMVLVASLALASRLLMDIYFQELRIPEVSDTSFYRCLFVFTFYPVLLCLNFAQLAPILLLGLAGFLFYIRRERFVLAGSLLALTAAKPQLLFLVWIAVFLDFGRRKRWGVLLSAFGVIGALTVIALFFDPRAFRHYRELVGTPYLSINPSGITAMIRRSLIGRQTYWMQFVPPLFGVAWLGFYWCRRRATWNWVEEMPLLVTMSVFTSAYGWVFDQTVLGLVVIAVAARSAKPRGRIPWNLVVWYTGLNCVLMLLLVVPPLTYIPAPLILLYFLYRETRAAENLKQVVAAGAE